MNGIQQNSMGANPFNAGGNSQNFGAPGAQGFSGLNGNFGGNMMDPMGFNNQMNGIGQQHGAMSQMMDQMMGVMTMMTQMIMLKQMQAMVSSMANFGGSSGGSSGVGNFLGGNSGGGTSSVGGSSAPTATSSDFGNVAGWGKDMAKYAEANANGPGGYCFKWASQALKKFGISTSGASAYMAADQLAKSDKVREVKIDGKDLAKLPAGAIVVWDRGNGHQHGHIAIALGDGREASDKIRQQTTTSYGTSFRVFLPK